ncbi:hypothetical protein GGI12_005589, partial [Dipsacomyces acuminosporus]
ATLSSATRHSTRSSASAQEADNKNSSSSSKTCQSKTPSGSLPATSKSTTLAMFSPMSSFSLMGEGCWHAPRTA